MRGRIRSVAGPILEIGSPLNAAAHALYCLDTRCGPNRAGSVLLFPEASLPGRHASDASHYLHRRGDGFERDRPSRAFFYAQNGSYATLEQLTSSDSLTMSRTERDGYGYTVETSPGGFIATARHAAPPPPANGGQPTNYPVLSVDQSMQIHQGP